MCVCVCVCVGVEGEGQLLEMLSVYHGMLINMTVVPLTRHPGKFPWTHRSSNSFFISSRMVC